jgi:hypothetical protein
MKHLDDFAGLKGEVGPLLNHLMGDKESGKGWIQWFPLGVSDETIVPRQMASLLLQTLTKCKKVWEQSEEHATTLRAEIKDCYETLSRDSKRRCLALA